MNDIQISQPYPSQRDASARPAACDGRKAEDFNAALAQAFDPLAALLALLTPTPTAATDTTTPQASATSTTPTTPVGQSVTTTATEIAAQATPTTQTTPVGQPVPTAPTLITAQLIPTTPTVPAAQAIPTAPTAPVAQDTPTTQTTPTVETAPALLMPTTDITIPAPPTPAQADASPPPAPTAQHPPVAQTSPQVPTPQAPAPTMPDLPAPMAITAAPSPAPEASTAPVPPVPALPQMAEPVHATAQVVVIQADTPPAAAAPTTPAAPPVAAQVAQLLPATPAVVHLERTLTPTAIDGATEAVLAGHAPDAQTSLVQATAVTADAQGETRHEESDADARDAETPAPPPSAPNAGAPEAPSTVSADPTHFIEQIAAAVRERAQSPQQQITVQLAPASLGLVRIRVSARNGSEITAHVEVDDPDVRAALEQHTGALRQALSDAGLAVDACSFSLGSGTQERADTPFQAPTPRWVPSAAPPPAPRTPAPMVRRAAQGAVLDCLV